MLSSFMRKIPRFAPNIHLNLLGYFYSGPEFTPDYTQDFPLKDDDWAIEKSRDERERVRQLGKGSKLTGKDKLVDGGDKAVYDLPHRIFSRNAEKYVCNDYIPKVTGNAQPIKQKSADAHVIDPDFLNPQVQTLLKKLTGKDLNKLFSFRPGKYDDMPRLRLLTDAQLEQDKEEKMRDADEMLVMPQIMLEREEIDEVIAIDPQLDGYERANVVFTDISEDVPKNERWVVVRESSGLLRKAKWDERDRVMQIYYHLQGRNLIKPFLFDDMSFAFEHGHHENLLKQLSVQFEPDSREYIHLIQQVYDDIDKRSLYDSLRSTRFFGGLVFYLTKHHNIDNLLLDMLKKQMISDCVNLLELFTIIKPESQTAKNLCEKSKCDPIKAVEVFVENDAINFSSLKLAIQNYKFDGEEATEHAAIS